jgi:hypothetical protein
MAKVTQPRIVELAEPDHCKDRAGRCARQEEIKETGVHIMNSEELPYCSAVRH